MTASRQDSRNTFKNRSLTLARNAIMNAEIARVQGTPEEHTLRYERRKMDVELRVEIDKCNIRLEDNRRLIEDIRANRDADLIFTLNEVPACLIKMISLIFDGNRSQIIQYGQVSFKEILLHLSVQIILW